MIHSVELAIYNTVDKKVHFKLCPVICSFFFTCMQRDHWARPSCYPKDNIISSKLFSPLNHWWNLLDGCWSWKAPGPTCPITNYIFLTIFSVLSKELFPLLKNHNKQQHWWKKNYHPLPQRIYKWPSKISTKNILGSGKEKEKERVGKITYAPSPAFTWSWQISVALF